MKKIQYRGAVYVEASGASSLNNWMKARKAELSKLPIPKLQVLMKMHKKWFDESPEDVDEEVDTSSVKSMVDYIMGSDPIAAEGGLMDFLDRARKRGILPKD